MDEVKKWLDGGGTFEEGIALLSRFTRNRSKAARILRCRNKYLLQKELQRIAGSSAKMGKRSPAGKQPADKERIGYDNLPEELKSFYEAAVEALRKMRSVHEKMKLATTDADRAKLRQELLALEDKKNASFALIDTWKKTGQLPEPANDPPPVDNYNTVPAARLAVSRWVKLLGVETDSIKIAELRAKIQAKVDIILQAGGKFTKLEEPLKKHGFLPK